MLYYLIIRRGVLGVRHAYKIGNYKNITIERLFTWLGDEHHRDAWHERYE